MNQFLAEFRISVTSVFGLDLTIGNYNGDVEPAPMASPLSVRNLSAVYTQTEMFTAYMETATIMAVRTREII